MKAVALACVALLLGCAPTVSAVRQSATSAEKVILAADSALEEADAKRLTEDKARFEAGDKEGAKADYQAWLKIYDQLKKAIDDAHLSIKAVTDVLPLAELGLNKSPDTAAWLGQIMKTVTNVVELLSAFGLSIGGVK